MDNPAFNSTDLIKNQDFFNKFDNIITCTFCQGFLLNPLECSECRNLYCSQCLKTWELNKGGNVLCPMKCKKNIFINAHKGIIQILEQLIIRCYRCSNFQNYNDLENHIRNTCEKLKIRCNNQGCNEQISKDNIEAHYLLCEYGTTQCEECGQSTIRKNLKNNFYNKKILEEKNKEIDNLKGTLESILKDNIILKENHEKEKENIRLKEDSFQKEYDSLKSGKENLQRDYESIKLINENLQQKFEILINESSPNKINNIYDIFCFMLLYVENEKKVNRHISAFEILNGIIENKKNFLNSKQIMAIFEKLLFFHSSKKTYNDKYYDSLNTLIGNIFDYNKEVFKSEVNFSHEIIDKFFQVYSLDTKVSDEDMVIRLKLFNNRIMYILPEFITGNYLKEIINKSLKFLEHKNPEVREFASLIFANLAADNKSYCNLNIEEILTSLNKAVNYESDGKRNDQYEVARDRAIYAIGEIIFYQHKHFNYSNWVSKWLSLFTLDLKFKQIESYFSLCLILNHENSRARQVLLGETNENIPSIIIILANILNTDIVTDESKSRIRTFFKELKDNVSLHKYVIISKDICTPKILKILNKELP